MHDIIQPCSDMQCILQMMQNTIQTHSDYYGAKWLTLYKLAVSIIVNTAMWDILLHEVTITVQILHVMQNILQ